MRFLHYFDPNPSYVAGLVPYQNYAELRDTVSKAPLFFMQAIWEPEMTHAFIVSVTRCKRGAELLASQALEALQLYKAKL